MNSTLKSKKWFPPDISDSLERFIPKKTTSISNPNPVTPIIVLIRATATHLMRLSLVMKHKNWLFALLIIGCSFDVQAQSFITKEADRAMQDLDYVTAINLYQQILLRESDNNGIKSNWPTVTGRSTTQKTRSDGTPNLSAPKMPNRCIACTTV